MNTKRVLVGTLVAGVAMFFLGWFIYGILMSGFMEANCNGSMNRPEDQMVWWALILSNFVWGLLLSLIIEWSGRFAPGPGAKVGAIFGFLTSLGFDLGMYAMTTFFYGRKVILADSLSYAALFAITGALTAWVMGRVSRVVVNNATTV